MKRRRNKAPQLHSDNRFALLSRLAYARTRNLQLLHALFACMAKPKRHLS